MVVTLELGRLIGVNSDGDGGGAIVDGQQQKSYTVFFLFQKSKKKGINIHSVRDNGGQQEAGAVGLAGRNGQETITGTSDLTGTVVTTAVAGGGNSGNEGSDDGEGLHLCRL